MRRIIKSAIFGGVALAMPAMAHAADLPTPPVIYYPPETVVEVPPGAFYFRLDLGYKIYRDPEVTFNLPLLGYDVPGDGEYINESLSNTWLAGFGVGYDFGTYLRTDLTIDYEFGADFEGELYCGGCDPTPPQYSYETATISAWSFLLNGYIDFGTRGGPITPYIGAGIGVAALTTTNVAFVNPDTSTGVWQGTKTWNFAWALMAGFSVDMSERVALDINYRYIHLGTAMAITDLGTNNDTPIVYDNIAAHEIRVGFRYTLW